MKKRVVKLLFLLSLCVVMCSCQTVTPGNGEILAGTSDTTVNDSNTNEQITTLPNEVYAPMDDVYGTGRVRILSIIELYYPEYDLSATTFSYPVEKYEQYKGKTLTLKECVDLFGVPFDGVTSGLSSFIYFTSDGYEVNLFDSGENMKFASVYTEVKR